MRTFNLFVHHEDSATPSLELEVLRHLSGVRLIAERTLRTSPTAVAVEVFEGDCLLFRLEREDEVQSGDRAVTGADRKTASSSPRAADLVAEEPSEGEGMREHAGRSDAVRWAERAAGRSVQPRGAVRRRRLNGDWSRASVA